MNTHTFKFIIFFFGLLLLSTTSSMARIFVLSVGIADYRSEGMNLRYSDDDAYRIYAYFKSCEGGGVPDANIKILVDEAAAKSNILQTMRSLFSQAKADDIVIFYFSGHGLDGGLVPGDYHLRKALLSYEEIKAVFRDCTARTKICMIDACYAGSLSHNSSTPSPHADLVENTAVILLMSSMPYEVSQENVNIRQGVFTYYLIKGMKGSADIDKNGSITIAELYRYIRANTLNFTKERQTPMIYGKFDLDRILVRL
ncbi:MAG: caspase family protein [Bernardetiaceae bacterium]|nr:caspase family protein [Bernardetiaceae bacterium]